MKNLMVFLIFLGILSCKQNNVVTIKTDYGDVKIQLFDSTPQHRDNFKKLVKDGFYNDLLFHRVISGFMIQGGDPDSKNAPEGQMLGSGGPGYTIPQEIGIPHFKGMVAAARQGDAVNPEKASSGSQFYIVHGQPVTEDMLNMVSASKNISYSVAQKEKYFKLGGTPMLDGDYTVFGEVVEGLEVIDKIAAAQCDERDRPIKDIKMRIH
jgi:cyclophilin family peptidyl-prolyl cis-trans isomerase